jgi:hypothetical protein
MKLAELAKEPKLISIKIDDPGIVEKYGEDVEFWVYDRVDMETFMALANLEGGQDIGRIVAVMKDLILDDKGNKVIANGKILPNDVMIKAVEKTVEALGNFATQTSQK